MRHILRPSWLAPLLLSTLMFSSPCSLLAATMSAEVIEVLDGDTILVREGENEHKVRLLGIDAPETKQSFGAESQRALAERIAGQHIVVDYQSRDKQKRILGKVIFQGQDMNLLLLQHGLAWHYKSHAKYQDVADRKLYAESEKLARRFKIGLWVEKWPQAPWAFRSKAAAQPKR